MTRDPVTEKAPSSRIEIEAQRLYGEMTDNHPTIHTNRFPGWTELPPAEKATWYVLARKSLRDAKFPLGVAERINAYAKTGSKSFTDALRAIAEGHPATVEPTLYVKVENPKFMPDDGSDPFLVIDLVPNPPPAVPARRVKPLPWRDMRGVWIADTILGRYAVWTEALALPEDKAGKFKSGKSVEQLKAMAQEHFEAAIASVHEDALDPRDTFVGHALDKAAARTAGAEEEREACARIVDAEANATRKSRPGRSINLDDIAAKIRRRGDVEVDGKGNPVPQMPVADAEEAGRFHALMHGQDAVAVWRGRAERLGAALDTLRDGIADLKTTLDAVDAETPEGEAL
jgi:hypothetical protein